MRPAVWNVLYLGPCVFSLGGVCLYAGLGSNGLHVMGIRYIVVRLVTFLKTSNYILDDFICYQEEHLMKNSQQCHHLVHHQVSQALDSIVLLIAHQRWMDSYSRSQDSLKSFSVLY